MLFSVACALCDECVRRQPRRPGHVCKRTFSTPADEASCPSPTQVFRFPSMLRGVLEVQNSRADLCHNVQ